MKIKWRVFILLIALHAQTVAAHFEAELSRNGSESSYSNNFSLGGGSESQTVTYSYSSALTQVNLNSSLSDFDINYDTHDISYLLALPAGLTLDANCSLTKLNNDEARIEQYSAGLYLRVSAVQMGFSLSQAKTSQVKDAVVLNRNYKDEIKFNQKAVSYYADVQWTDSFLTVVKYTYYSYDENLDNFNTLLTTQVFLNRAGGAVANEVQAQLRNSAEANMVFTLNESWLVDMAIGSSQENLNPSDRLNDARIGAEYEFSVADVNYKIFYSLSGSKNVADNNTSTSHLLGFGADF